MSTTRAGTSPRPRSEAKRERILEVAMRHFAERGYGSTRVEDIAAELRIAKGSIFQHFKTKGGLFLATYRKAVLSLPRYLDAPAEVLQQGFFAIIRYWLERTEHLIQEDRVRFRVAMLGDNGTDWPLKREINRFMTARDPYGTVEFVRRGIESGEVRADIDSEMIISVVDWVVGRFQEATLDGRLEAGAGSGDGAPPRRVTDRIDQMVEMVRGAIGRQ